MTMDARKAVDDYYHFQEAAAEENIILSSRYHQGVDFKIAFGVEKLLNLETLVMETARQAADMDQLTLAREEDLRMAFQFDVLRTLVDAEADELQKLADSIRTDIQSVEPGSPESRVKLQAATDSLNQMQDLIAAITRESATFDRARQQPLELELQGTMSPRITPEDQASVLQMLQKSIASELDLDKELCDARSVVEELKLKLYQAEHHSYLFEEYLEAIYERMLSAENTSQVFLGTSKDLLAKINTTSDSIQRPVPEFSTLQDRIQKLEEWLRDFGSPLVPRGSSQVPAFQGIIKDLKIAISKAQCRMQDAEARCTQLTQANDQLRAELNSDRAGILEKRLKESDTQLEHAKASVDAVVQQQSMLKSSMCDMEETIQDLKDKFSKAETRAENAESKCKLLTDTNLELGEELSFLRGRVEGLENSLRQANQLKKSTEKDIHIKTKTIGDLVAKLALERERLHLQNVTLTRKNKMLAQKCRGNVNENPLLSKKAAAKEGELGTTIDSKDETVVDHSSTQRKVTPTVSTIRDQEAEVSPPLEDDSGADITLETVRSIEPSQLNWKYVSSAALVFLAAVLMYLLYKEGGNL